MGSTSTRWRWATPLAVPLAALALSACGSDAKPTGPNAATATTTLVAVGQPVTTSPAASVAGGVQSPASQAAGGALPTPDTFKVCDAITQAEASTATQVALGPPTDNGGDNCLLSATGYSFYIHLVRGDPAKSDFDQFEAAAQADPRDYNTVSAGDRAFSNLTSGRVLKGTLEAVIDLSVDLQTVKPGGADLSDTTAAHQYYATTLAALLQAIAPHLPG